MIFPSHYNIPSIPLYRQYFNKVVPLSCAKFQKYIKYEFDAQQEASKK